MVYAVICKKEKYKKAYLRVGDRRTMRGTHGRVPHIPYQIQNIPYQIWNSMYFYNECVNSRGTEFHIPSYHGVYAVLAGYPIF